MSDQLRPSRPQPPGRILATEELVSLLDGLAGRPYMSEVVDQRTHALQCAELAIDHGADNELVIGAALHDIGRADPVAHAYPDLPHELSGGAFARDRLTERIAWVIEQHVPAKRYLVATDAHYQSALSPTSVATLANQGGPMSTAEIAEFEQHSWWPDAIALRRWDDQAKDPDKPGIPIDDLLTVFERWSSTLHR